MAFKCIICGKKTTSGNSVSHSHKASKRKFKPNLQKIRITIKGRNLTALVCTKCIKSNRVVKAV